MEEDLNNKSTFIQLIIISLLVVSVILLTLIILSAFQVDHFSSSDPGFGLFSKFNNIYLPLLIISTYLVSLIFMLNWKKWAYFVFQITSIIVLILLFLYSPNEYLSVFLVVFLIIILMLYSKQFGKKADIAVTEKEI